MEIPVDVTLESKKEWTEPELKKIDVEEITAAGGSSANADAMFMPS